MSTKKKNINDALEGFIDENKPKKQDNNKKYIQEKTGLIERVDKVIVTKDGRQLLSEHC